MYLEFILFYIESKHIEYLLSVPEGDVGGP